MGQVLHHVILRDIGGKKRVILNWLRSHDPAFQHRRPFSPRLQDIRIVMVILLWRIMVAAAVDMVAYTHRNRKTDFFLIVNVSGKTAFPAASGTDGLATRPVFLEMESVFTHSSVFLISASRKAICSLQSLQFCRDSPLSMPRNCKTEKTASCNREYFLAVFGWLFIFIHGIFAGFIHDFLIMPGLGFPKKPAVA